VAPDLNKEFRIEVNASNYTTGGVLSLKCSDGLWRPVAFILKSLRYTESVTNFIQTITPGILDRF